MSANARTAKAAKVDYSTYTHEMLFKELDSTSEQIAKLDKQIENLQGKKAQIEQALADKYEPNDETIKALRESINGEGQVVEASEFSAYDFHQQMLAELENENRA